MNCFQSWPALLSKRRFPWKQNVLPWKAKKGAWQHWPDTSQRSWPLSWPEDKCLEWLMIQVWQLFSTSCQCWGNCWRTDPKMAMFQVLDVGNQRSSKSITSLNIVQHNSEQHSNRMDWRSFCLFQFVIDHFLVQERSLFVQCHEGWDWYLST